MGNKIDFWDVVQVNDDAEFRGRVGYVAGIGAHGSDDPDRSMFVIFYDSDDCGTLAERDLSSLDWKDDLARTCREDWLNGSRSLRIIVDRRTGKGRMAD